MVHACWWNSMGALSGLPGHMTVLLKIEKIKKQIEKIIKFVSEI